MNDLPVINFQPNFNRHAGKYSLVSQDLWALFEEELGAPVGYIANLTRHAISSTHAAPFDINLTEMREVLKALDGADAVVVDLEDDYTTARRHFDKDPRFRLSVAAAAYAVAHVADATGLPVSFWSGIGPKSWWKDGEHWTHTVDREVAVRPFAAACDFYNPSFYAKDGLYGDNKAEWDRLLGCISKLQKELYPEKPAVACLWWRGEHGMLTVEEWSYILVRVWKEGYRKIGIWGNDRQPFAQKRFGITTDPEQLEAEQWPMLQAVIDSKFGKLARETPK